MFEKFNLLLPSKLQSLELSSAKKQDINISIKRDDEIHPIVCGNKWRKLKFNLIKLIKNNTTKIISFGGSWSNHLHALGWCCYQLDIKLIAVVRGESGRFKSAMIADLEKWGAEIYWVTRKDYRQRNDNNWINELKHKFGVNEVIPEGGSNSLAFPGVAELVEEVIEQSPKKIDYFCTAVGSGGTLAGLIEKFQGTGTKIIGIPVVKGRIALEESIEKLLSNRSLSRSDWELIEGYEFGGYAKFDEALSLYIKKFYENHKIILEPVYTAKLLWAVEELSNKGFFKQESNIVLLHSGGLQGLRGLRKFSLDDWFRGVSLEHKC